MILESMYMTRLIETPGVGIVKEILAAEGHTPVAVGVVEDSPAIFLYWRCHRMHVRLGLAPEAYSMPQPMAARQRSTL